MTKPSKVDWKNESFEDSDTDSLVFDSIDSSPIAVLPSPILSDIPFGQVVEDTFKQHFSTHGYQAIDLLSKVDPNNYIKHVVSLVPKQVATKSITEVTTNGVTVSRELIQSLDIISGVTPIPALPSSIPSLEEYPW